MGLVLFLFTTVFLSADFADQSWAVFSKQPDIAYGFGQSLKSGARTVSNCSIPKGAVAKIEDYDANSRVYTMRIENKVILCGGRSVKNAQVKIPRREGEETIRNFSTFSSKKVAMEAVSTISGAKEIVVQQQVKKKIQTRPNISSTISEGSEESRALTSSPTKNPTLMGKITAPSGLRVRSGPGVDGNKVIGAFSNGASVPLTGKSKGNWYEVDLGENKTGWISKGTRNHLMKIESAPTASMRPQQRRRSSVSSRNQDVETSEVLVSTSENGNASSGQERLQSTKESSGRDKSKPSGDGRPYMRIASKDEVKKFRDQIKSISHARSVADVEINSSQGIDGSSESHLNEPEINVYQPRVNGYLNMRKGPGTGNEVLKQLRSNDHLVFLGEKDGAWRKVKDINTGEKGWVSGNYLMKTGDTIKVSQIEKNKGVSLNNFPVGQLVEESTPVPLKKYDLGTLVSPEKEDAVAQRLVTGMVAYMGAVYQSCEPIMNIQKDPKKAIRRSSGSEEGRINPPHCYTSKRKRGGISYRLGGPGFKGNTVQTTKNTDCSATIGGVMASRGMKMTTGKSPKRFTTAYIHQAYQSRETSCMYTPSISKDFSLQPGDILNTANNHQVMVYKTGADPLGLGKVKTRDQCTSIDRRDFDFTVFHNTNRVYPHDGRRRKGPHFIEAKYLASHSITSLAIAVRKFCLDNWPSLTGRLSDNKTFGAKGWNKGPAYFSLQRHYGQKKKGCMSDNISPVEHGGCISEKCYEAARKDVFPELPLGEDQWDGIKREGEN